VNALGFFFLLATGLILYLPRLSELVSRRQTIQAYHFWGGVGWLGVLAVVVVLGGRRLLATARELERFDRDDLRWLRGRKAPQGRFNAGQKINAALTAAFTILFGLSGLLLWFGEQDTRLRFASTVFLPRRPDVHLARASRRAPLSRPDPPGDAPRAPRDDARATSAWSGR